MMPRSVARYVESWGYSLQADDFGTNYLSSRISLARGGEGEIEFAFASLCAVPHRRVSDIYANYNAFLSWLEPKSLAEYEPPGAWLPSSGRTFTSAGVVLTEDDHSATRPRSWRAYLLAARDGYFEHGRRAGRLLRGRMAYPFAPMVAWIQRFVSMVQEAGAMQRLETNYTILLNLPTLENAALAAFGAGWHDPFRWEGDPVPTAIESRSQLQFNLEDGDAKHIARLFAERIDNVFGVHESVPRCYNSPGPDERLGAAGELPGNYLDYRL